MSYNCAAGPDLQKNSKPLGPQVWDPVQVLAGSKSVQLCLPWPIVAGLLQLLIRCTEHQDTTPAIPCSEAD